MKKFKVGIVGYGWVATAHIPAINAATLAEVTAIYSSRKLDAAEVSAKYGGRITVYNDLDQMLANPEIDVLSLCGLPTQHADQVVRAAKAGKHLIIEKPLALSLKELRVIQKAVKQSGIKTCVCFECRFSSQFLAIKAVIDRGLLGSLHYGEVDYYHGIGPWYAQFRWCKHKDAGGSSLLEAGCHAMDALLLCMGTDVVEVTSYGTKSRSKLFAPYEYPEHQREHPQIQGRQRRQVHVLDRLSAAVLLSYAPGGQQRQPARQQVPLLRTRHQQGRLEQPGHEDARFRRRLGPPVSNPV